MALNNREPMAARSVRPLQYDDTIHFSPMPMAIAPENKCSRCPSRCCTYFTHAINPPRSMADFDYLLWQISHREVQVYKDDDGWFLLVNMPCTHLLPDGRCGIYAVRPAICRNHSNDFCEADAPAEESFTLFFDGYAALDAYCRKRFKGWDRRHRA